MATLLPYHAVHTMILYCSTDCCCCWWNGSRNAWQFCYATQSAVLSVAASNASEFMRALSLFYAFLPSESFMSLWWHAAVSYLTIAYTHACACWICACWWCCFGCWFFCCCCCLYCLLLLLRFLTHISSFTAVRCCHCCWCYWWWFLNHVIMRCSQCWYFLLLLLLLLIPRCTFLLASRTYFIRNL